MKLNLGCGNKKIEGYIKPKVEYKKKRVFFKKNLNDIDEIVFDNLYDAAKKTGFCKEVVRRKCKINNSYDNIFRYEDGEYNFNVKNGGKIKIISTDENGNEKIYESATDAAKDINGNVSTIIAVCKGKRKKHKKLTFKYF